MEATQVKPETTVAPPEGPGKKSPQLTPPKKKRKWVKRLVIPSLLREAPSFLM